MFAFFQFWGNDLSTQNSKDESLSLVSRFIFTGAVLSLDTGMHCLTKNSLKRLALSRKSATSLLSTSSGGMSGIFPAHLVYLCHLV